MKEDRLKRDPVQLGGADRSPSIWALGYRESREGERAAFSISKSPVRRWFHKQCGDARLAVCEAVCLFGGGSRLAESAEPGSLVQSGSGV